MADDTLLSVEEALARILGAVPGPLPGEFVPIDQALDRVLAEPVIARRTQPPFAASAMDGYAVRAADIVKAPVTLKIIGEVAAGHRFSGPVGAGEAVRIFTGAPMPDGADTIVIQEETARNGTDVTITRSPAPGRNVRQRGIDFIEGNPLLSKGRRLGPMPLTLAAASGNSGVFCVRKPKVAILSTGDELVRPGDFVGENQIIASNTYGIIGIARRCGAEVCDLGIARDTRAEIVQALAQSRDWQADVLVTIGGASVGDHDLVRPVLAEQGGVLNFYKIAIRPGKPVNFGRIGSTYVVGLPGNPASSLVCSILFLAPLLKTLAGLDATAPIQQAMTTVDLQKNDFRCDYLRASLNRLPDGTQTVTPFPNQDSSLVLPLAGTDALLIRPPHASFAPAGTLCPVLRLADCGLGD